MILNKQKDVPEEISKVKMIEWYSGLRDQEKVKVKRYFKDADLSSALSFSLSIMKAAVHEENNSVAVLVGENILKSRLSGIDRFCVLEEIIPAYFGVRRYDDCLRCCEEGLALIPSIMKKIKKRNGGSLPEKIQCRNYTINVLVGAYGKYDEGDNALDRFFEMGIISEEDVIYRKQSHKVHKLQRTFDGVFSVKLKDQ
jgi:hypothetical protein